MIPGSWLEVSKYEPSLAAKIFSYGFVKTFVVTEVLDQAVPELPFIILVDSLDKISKSKWQFCENFCGFLWRTNTIPETKPSIIQNLWIEIIIDDLKSANVSISRAKNWKPTEIFITANEKLSARKLNKVLKTSTLSPATRPHDLADKNFHQWEHLEIFDDPEYDFNSVQKPELSIIIPHFETAHFLCNVLKHLQNSVSQTLKFEVLVIDDGSSTKSYDQIIYFARRHLSRLPLKIFRWKETHSLNDGAKIFRAGASRNWGAAKAQADNLFFIDADMLTPINIVETVLTALQKADVVQFVRKHIPYHLSSETCVYNELINSKNLYVEESGYWNALFQSAEWSDLADYWKYTCTYALAIKKNDFINLGRLRRNFIRYGFEDTDLGFRLFKANRKFLLEKTPLLHLTNKPDLTQGFLFKLYKMNRISPMAKTFYKLNLDSEIYSKFQSLLD